jgi:hypothetical protein
MQKLTVPGGGLLSRRIQPTPTQFFFLNDAGQYVSVKHDLSEALWSTTIAEKGVMHAWTEFSLTFTIVEVTFKTACTIIARYMWRTVVDVMWCVNGGCVVRACVCVCVCVRARVCV